MPAKLIIRLHNNQLFDWVQTDHNHQIIASAYQQVSLALAKLQDHTTIVFLVPTTDVTLLSAKIPRMNRAQLSRALPYAIEDQLCEDIEQLHFAAGHWQSDGETLALAVVAQAKMQEWLALCAAAEIMPDIIMPDVLALPYSPEQWTCQKEHNLLLLRTGLQSGLAIEIEQAPLIFNQLSIDEKKLHTTSQPLVLHALTNSNHNINLLQGPYKSTHKKWRVTSAWHFTIKLAIAALILFILAEIAGYFAMKIENDRLQQQITVDTQQLLPGEALDNLAKPRLERELRLLTKVGQGNEFLESINIIAASLAHNTAITLTQIIYQNNLMTLQVQATHPQAIKNWLLDLRTKKITIIKISQQSQNNSTEIIIKGA